MTRVRSDLHQRLKFRRSLPLEFLSGGGFDGSGGVGGVHDHLTCCHVTYGSTYIPHVSAGLASPTLLTPTSASATPPPPPLLGGWNRPAESPIATSDRHQIDTLDSTAFPSFPPDFRVPVIAKLLRTLRSRNNGSGNGSINGFTNGSSGGWRQLLNRRKLWLQQRTAAREDARREAWALELPASSSSLAGGEMGRSGLLASSSLLSGGEVALVSPASVPGGVSVARDRSRTQVARDNRRAAADLRCGRVAVMAWSCRKRRWLR